VLFRAFWVENSNGERADHMRDWRLSIRLGAFHWMAVLLCAVLSPLQTSQAQDFETIDLDSKVYKNGRPILVHLPTAYQEEARKYPVLYVLNGEDNFRWASQIADLLAELNEIDSMIVVGLPDQGDYGGDNYPFASEETSDPSPDAARYAAFLRSEVIPYVDANYRTEKARFIAGHSLSGLFVTNLFLTDPDGFNLFIATSPSLQYAPQMSGMVQEQLNSGGERGALYFTIGELEHKLIQDGFSRMRAVLEAHGSERDSIQVDSIPYNNHRSAAYAGLYDALSWAYSGWGTHESMPERFGSVEGIVAHYQRLSDRLGYEIKPREGDLAGMAGFLLHKLSDPEGAAIGYQAELHFYPDSEEAEEGYEQALAASSDE